MASKEELHQNSEPPHPPYGPPPEVILETQLNSNNRSRGNIYNGNLISIGFDNPTTSRDERERDGNNDLNQGKLAKVVNTPLHNNANSLMALGEHVLTPSQGRLWEC